MTMIESLHDDVLRAVPSAALRLREPRDPQGVWWLDARVDDHHVVVQWSPRRGFGVSASAIEDGYGEGPEETYDDVEAASARVINLLERRSFTSPPPAVALRELRALLGLTQVDVAQRLGIGQAAVSRLEHRDDITLGSLQRYVEALGAGLDIRVLMPAGESVSLVFREFVHRTSSGTSPPS